MSGRSAYVRKKITQTKIDNDTRLSPTGTLGNEQSTVTVDEYPTVAPGPSRGGHDVTGVASSNARLLTFADSGREHEMLTLTTSGDGSLSSDSLDGRRQSAHFFRSPRPLDDSAYARARRPVIKTEDVGGIAKSGMRDMMDKKSEEVRGRIAKAFAFGSKKPKAGEVFETTLEIRPGSASTVRPNAIHTSSAPSHELEADMPPLHEHNQPQYPNSAHMQQQPWDLANGPLSPPPSSKLPALPLPSAMAPPIKRWIGSGRPVQRWNKLRKDPELWDPNGDVLVYFGHKAQMPRPNPSFRLSSHIIEATESRFLITLLREGSTEDDITLPPTPKGAPPMLHRQAQGSRKNHHHHLGPRGGPGRGAASPTPPTSEDVSLAELDGQISYEMFFPPSATLSKTDQLRHNITTRNVFALLYHASLVGLSLYQTLTDLQRRLEEYMTQMDNLSTIVSFLSARGIDDVRNDAETAIGLLAWSEIREIRWEEGWREGFLHAAGMYNGSGPGVESCTDFKYVSPITRALLERASLETQLRVQAAEERMAGFSFGDMWPPSASMISPPSGPVMPSPAKACADRLGRFLLAHYSRIYGQWPPLPPPSGHHRDGNVSDGEEDIWLTRTVAQALQKDFGALYDYLVNRDIVWDKSETRPSRKWLMVSESGNKAFEADTCDLPMQDMLVEFDNKQRFPHIPHPYPLVPESIPATVASRPQSSGGKSSKSAAVKRGIASERRVQLAYSEATNIYTLGSDFTQSNLIDAFVKFERSDHIGEVDPSTARRGRWILIYGILQTLASVSVDAPNVRYRDEVPYHLSPRLKGARMPPWFKGSSHQMVNHDEAIHELSHCWVVPRTWNNSDVSASGGDDSDNMSPAGMGMEDQVLPLGYGFPVPPPPSTTQGDNSTMNRQSSAAARSTYSSMSSRAPSAGGHYGSSAPFSSAGSVMSMSMSESEAGSWPMPMPKAKPRIGGSGGRKSSRSRDGRPANTSDAAYGPRKTSRSRGIARVDENEGEVSLREVDEWATEVGISSEKRRLKVSTSYDEHTKPKSGRKKTTGNTTDYLGLDSLVETRRGSFSTAVGEAVGEVGQKTKGRRSRSPRPLLNPSPSVGGSEETESLAPMILDFDDLDLDDSHAC